MSGGISGTDYKGGKMATKAQMIKYLLDNYEQLYVDDCESAVQDAVKFQKLRLTKMSIDDITDEYEYSGGE